MAPAASARAAAGNARLQSLLERVRLRQGQSQESSERQEGEKYCSGAATAMGPGFLGSGRYGANKEEGEKNSSGAASAKGPGFLGSGLFGAAPALADEDLLQEASSKKAPRREGEAKKPKDHKAVKKLSEKEIDSIVERKVQRAKKAGETVLKKKAERET